jgi:hypothetical protein
VAGQRNGLLAKIHIAKEQLGLSREDYEAVLIARFGVKSAAALSRAEMEELLKAFIACGWIPAYRGRGRATQLEALRDRIAAEAVRLENGPARVRPLCTRICGVADPAWCQDAERLKGLLAAIQKIAQSENRVNG